MWRMKRDKEVSDGPEKVSSPGYDDSQWMEAIVPGTVLHSLVENGVYPDPYFGDNNDIEKGLIPDLAKAGRDQYTYWFRTKLEFPYAEDPGRRIWMQFDGINYHAEVSQYDYCLIVLIIGILEISKRINLRFCIADNMKIKKRQPEDSEQTKND